jgi:2-dehydro-3-deoxyphosphogluconate aldolase / (4S)-4-hydroxy-2-oxoglutarate aldolase
MTHQRAESPGLPFLELQLRTQAVLPVVVPDTVEQAVAVAHALVAGGIRAMEVPLPGRGAQAIEAIAKAVPVMRVGAGMIVMPRDIDLAARLGAHFVTTPGTTEAMLKAANASGLEILPGVSTYAEVMLALAENVPLVRLFPADAVGGPQWLRAAQVVLPEARFSVAGGVNLRNAAEYLAVANVINVTGTWVVPGSFVSAGNWRGITELAIEAKQLIRHRA